MDTENATVTRLDETVAAVTAPDPKTIAVAALSDLAREFRWNKMPIHAARIDAIIRVLGMTTTDLEGLAADALMMTGYAPGVDDAAVAAGEAMLQVVADLEAGKPVPTTGAAEVRAMIADRLRGER